ncbi:MAG: hypothetical protein JNM27_16175 [Leptospirales bacterium]|nr:hypothetical protein [Leptospirales bacterium]
MIRVAIIAFAFVVSTPLLASATKECKVTAVVQSVSGSAEKPILKIHIRSASFERGHSMGEDCTFLESSLYRETQVELSSPVKASAGQEILLLFIDVRNVTPEGPRMHQHWEVHPDNGKKK